MAKEDMTPEAINARKIAEIESKHKEEMGALRDQIQLLQIIATQTTEAPPRMVNKKVIQIIMDSKNYFCETAEEKAIFFANHPESKKYKCQDCKSKFETPAVEDGKILVCPKCRSKLIFVNTEVFNLDLPVFIADPYLNDEENKKHFVRKDK
jgi:DNA-directed RNA polymerase subunit RPC12/RpoP